MIGGGSSSFVPPLFRRLIESSVLARLHSHADGRRCRTARGDGEARPQGGRERAQPAEVRATTDMREAITDADFVISAISVGGMTAWESDMEIPGKYGVVMHVADSIGPGGIMRTLRNAPISRASPRTSPTSPRTRGSSTTPTRRRSRRWRCAPSRVNVARPVLVQRRTRRAPSGLPSQCGVDARRDRDAAGGRRNQPLRGVMELRLRRTGPTCSRSPASTSPTRSCSGRSDVRRAPVLLVALDRVPPAMQRLDEPLRRHRPRV